MRGNSWCSSYLVLRAIKPGYAIVTTQLCAFLSVWQAEFCLNLPVGAGTLRTRLILRPERVDVRP